MAYTTGTASAQANAASAFMAILDPLLIAGGFTYIETWTSSTITAMIYKSPAASNTQNADWYLIVYRTADSAVAVSLAVAEVWDTSTKKVRNYAPVPTTFTPTAAFAVNDAVGILPNAATLKRVDLNIATSAFTYFVSVTANRVAISAKVGAADNGIYAGLYDDLLPAIISPFPLCVMPFSATNGGTYFGSTTREPNATASVGNCFATTIADQTLCSYSPTCILADFYQTKLIPARACFHGRSGIGSPPNYASGLRGLLKDVVHLKPASIVAGDSLTVTDPSGPTKTYVCFSGSVAMTGFWVDSGV